MVAPPSDPAVEALPHDIAHFAELWGFEVTHLLSVGRAAPVVYCPW